MASTLKAVALAFGLAAATVSAGDLAEVRESGVLTVISFPHQESEFVRTNLEAGPTPELGPASRFIGIDVDIMSAFAARLGVELQIRRVSEPSYGALIPDLLAGRGDLIASSLTITEERSKKVAFSVPYFTAYKVVVVRDDSSIDGLDDLAGRRGVVIEGSSHHEQLLGLGVPADGIGFVNFTLECFSAVLDGEADYTVVDSVAAAPELRAEPRLEIAFRLPGEDHYAVAVPKESTELLAELDAFLGELVSSGRLAEIIERHHVAR
ncbi:MAG: ABC transporter substrate-binding protein [Thermoanaerobaculales bacterium]|nr:ABC transporter substrate-binding protein [Thermoanaerobaculales bacterium]